MSTETSSIPVPRIRDADGLPTCRWGNSICPFYMVTGFGAGEICYWAPGAGKHRSYIERRGHNGLGSTMPGPECPVWGDVMAAEEQP